MLEIKSITFDQFLSDPLCSDLLDEHVAESANKEMTPIDLNKDLYRKLEASGSMKLLGAYNDGDLIGMLCLLVSPNLHYNKNIGTVESFFVRSEYRKTGAGLRLLKEAEKVAKDSDAIAVFLSAQIGSNLETVMFSKKDYKATNTIFFKSLL